MGKFRRNKRVALVSKKKKTLTSKVNKLSRIVKSNRNEAQLVEVNVAVAAVASSTATPATLLTDIDEGDGIGQRAGSEIKIFSVSIKEILSTSYVGTSAGIPANTWVYRIMLFIDKNTQPTATVPIASEVLELSTITDPTVAYMNWDNRHRFRMLYDKRVVVPSVQQTAALSTSDARLQRIVSKHCKLNHRPHFNTNDGANLGKGMIYLLIITNQAAAANTNQPAIQSNIRLLYTDV